MGDESPVNDDHPQSEPDPSQSPPRSQSVKFDTTAPSPHEEPSEVQAKPTADDHEPDSLADEANATSHTDSPNSKTKDDHDSHDPKSPERSTSPHDSEDSLDQSSGGHAKASQGTLEEAASATGTSSPDQPPGAVGVTNRPSASGPGAAETEYKVAEDGNIHINDKQKAAIRRLMHPEEQEDSAHLGYVESCRLPRYSSWVSGP